MSSFGAKGLTNKGRVLQAKAQAGVQLKYTKYVLGDAQLGGQSIATLNGVISPKKTVDVTRLKMSPPYESIVGFVLSNQDVTTGFFFRELGLYALDPDEGEILYWYANAGDTADYIPPTNTGDVINKTMDMYVYVGTAPNVTLTIDQNLAYVTYDELDEALDGLGTPSGTASGTVVNGNTAYTAALSPALTTLKAFQRVVVKTNVASTGAPTFNFDGLGAKAALKANGSPASLKAGGVYTWVYDGTAFILQGEGGEVGTATASDVLAPKTIGTDNGIVTGTIPTHGNQFKSGLWSNPDGDAYVDTYVNIDSGYYPPGSQVTIQIYDPDLISRNIRGDVEILGVNGDPNVVDTSDATATAGGMLEGNNGYVKGQKVTGNIPILTGIRTAAGAAIWPDGALAVYPEKGYQKGGSGDGEIKVTSAQLQVAEAALRSGNLPKDVSIFGVLGVLERMTTAEKQAIANAITGKGVAASVNDTNTVLASKISQIKTGIQIATGNTAYSSGPRTIANLPFKPQILIVYGRADTFNNSGYQARSNGYGIAYNTSGTTTVGDSLTAFLYSGGYEIERDIEMLTNVVFGANSVSFDGFTGTVSGNGTAYIVFGV